MVKYEIINIYKGSFGRFFLFIGIVSYKIEFGVLCLMKLLVFRIIIFSIIYR